jgi:RES domain
VIAEVDPARLAALVRSVGGDVFCHAPADRPFDLAALDRPDDPADRWSAPGARTAYLARDPLVAIAEYARHGPETGTSDDRRIVRLRLREVPTLDVRSSDVRSALGLGDADVAFLDREAARATSLAIRRNRLCQAILVPSIAFIDRPDRHNAIIFCEAIPGGLASVLSGPEEVGRIAIAG